MKKQVNKSIKMICLNCKEYCSLNKEGGCNVCKSIDEVFSASSKWRIPSKSRSALWKELRTIAFAGRIYRGASHIYRVGGDVRFREKGFSRKIYEKGNRQDLLQGILNTEKDILRRKGFNF